MATNDDPRTLGPARLGFADHADVDAFVGTLERFERGEIDADAWRAFRLVNGVYGQRQDGEMMVRCKIPQGILTPPQLLALAAAARSCGTGVGHVTTRQNVQLHFVAPDRVEPALRRLAEAGLTTREACGNAVRNVTGCPFAGTSDREPFDVTPYAEAVTRHLLRGPLSSTLPRKFKIAFGGCCGTDCVGAAINDLGFLARLHEGRPAFRVTIGGGLATMWRSGFVAEEALPAVDVLEAAEAVVRVFHRVGNRKDRNRARLKFVIHALGEAGFLELYRAERGAIRSEGGRRIGPATDGAAQRGRAVAAASGRAPAEGFAAFQATNVRQQKQQGFAAVTVRLPLGDVTSEQLETLASLAVLYGEGEVRTTHDQNVLLRFVPESLVADLHRELVRVGLGAAGARTAADVTSCPGSWSCKLAVTASRSLAAHLSEHLDGRPDLLVRARGVAIKASGCPNSCGQHPIAAIGFQGGMRRVAGNAVPQYHVTVGGGLDGDGAKFGKVVAKVPVRRTAEALERLLSLFAGEAAPGEAADVFFRRVPLERLRALLADLAEIDEATARPEDYVDLGAEGSFAVEVMAGECAV